MSDTMGLVKHSCCQHSRNISATTLFDLALLDERALLDQEMEWLIAHELGHQWFGDMVTCRSWPHIWLNEGWATYLELVWAEHDAGKAEYTHKAWKLLSSVAATDTAMNRACIRAVGRSRATTPARIAHSAIVRPTASAVTSAGWRR